MTSVDILKAEVVHVESINTEKHKTKQKKFPLSVSLPEGKYHS